MKRSLFQSIIVVFSLFLLLAYGFVVADAQDGQLSGGLSVFIPLLYNGPSTHTVAGRVVNPQNVPVAGVTIKTDHGQLAVTDLNGNYTIKNLVEGTYTITPSQDDTAFSPSTSTVVVPPDVDKLNFTAQLDCSEAIINGGFETNNGWEIPNTEYPAGYSTAEAHSGSRSMRTGIVNPDDNIFSYSSAQQKVTIPAGTTSATFTFWVKPFSGQVKSLSLPAQPVIGTPADQIQMSGDVQYVLVLDNNGNIINTLLWQLSDSRTWKQYQFSLAAYAGKTIWLHFGTYNDGLDGISSMFADDVSLVICPGGGSPTPTPTPGPCGNLFDNPSFETNSDWEIPLTAYSAGYSTDQAHTGARSMRTGILKSLDNVFSYSDFRQAVHIPQGAANAKASFWLYTLSGEAKNLAVQEMITPTGHPFSETPLSGDLQYVLILDQDQNWIDTLVWQRTDEGHWHYYEFDLRKYEGDTIYLQFGTYNDGLNGISSMFVDDVSLDDCAVTPTPSPTPTNTPTRTPTPTITPTPDPCQQLMVNSDFSGNNGWVILDTAYHAGYSNVEYHSAFRSMRTGIVNLADNVYSYSDFRQTVTIPANANNVTLGTWLYPISGESPLGFLPEPARTQFFGNAPMEMDVQYLLVLDADQNWIDTLVWMRSNSKSWTYMQFDLSEYAGKTIILQWGSYNNGTGGVTSMYVDDVTLQACP